MSSIRRLRLGSVVAYLLRPTRLILLLVSIAVYTRVFHPSSPKRTTYSKALVVATTQKSYPQAADWISQIPRDWAVYRYVTDLDPATPLAELDDGGHGLARVPVNKGNEAMAYLTYIIDHYDALPDVVFFHHDHRTAWHQDMPSEEQVTRLDPAHVMRRGYVSARCLPGCENVMNVGPDHVVDFGLFQYRGREAHLSTMMHALLGEGEDMPRKLAAPCCAQFAASREAIRRRERAWWVRARQWLLDSPLDSSSAGRILEYTWHFWLGEPAVHCPDYNECKCLVFTGDDDVCEPYRHAYHQSR